MNSHVLPFVKLAASIDFGANGDPWKPTSIHFHAVNGGTSNTNKPSSIVSAGTNDFVSERIYDLYRELGYGVIVTDSEREYRYLYLTLETAVELIKYDSKEFDAFFKKNPRFFDESNGITCPKPPSDRDCPAYYRSWLLANFIEKYNQFQVEKEPKEEEPEREWSFSLEGGRMKLTKKPEANSTNWTDRKSVV